MITLEIKDKSPILYRGQRFSLLARLLRDGDVDMLPDAGYGLDYGMDYGTSGAETIFVSLISQSGNDVLVEPLTMSNTGRSDYSVGLVDCIIVGSYTEDMPYQGDAIMVIQIEGGDTYRQTVRVI